MSRRVVSLGTSPLALLLIVLVGLGVAWKSFDRSDSTSAPPPTSHCTVGQVVPKGHVALCSLPPEAAQTVALIDKDGPFPYPTHDGGTFGNFEGLLPPERSGYYKEYTVPTPGESDRGARRIIAGADGTLYWTADHYEHFAVIER